MRNTFSKNTFSKRQWRKRAIRESPIHASRAEIHCRIFTSTSANEASGMSWTHWQKGGSFFGNAIELAQKGDLHLDNAASLKECLS
jgi:hypothetical protein